LQPKIFIPDNFKTRKELKNYFEEIQKRGLNT
jgi:hypothetical protein